MILEGIQLEGHGSVDEASPTSELSGRITVIDQRVRTSLRENLAIEDLKIQGGTTYPGP